MKYKTSELSGARLDQAVAKAFGMYYSDIDVQLSLDADFDPDKPITGLGARLNFASLCLACFPGKPLTIFSPSTSWADGGPIIEREKITLIKLKGDGWLAECAPESDDGFVGWQENGESPLIAAMRAFVQSKFGDGVEL